MTIHEFQQQRNSGSTEQELVASFQKRVQEQNPTLNAFLSTDVQFPEQDANPKSPLYGVPIAIKDVILTRGTRASAGSKMLEQYTASYDAHVITELKRAGAVLFGKTNCDEFAMGASNENSAFGSVKNPLDPTRVPGGSSGGSAAAVAADLCVAALGSDTGGSIRQPAAFCGVVGMKPTYGRVSRYGLIALCSSFDCIGPLTHSVEDAAILLETIAGPDPRDMTTAKDPVPAYSKHLQQDIRGLRVGVPKEYFIDGVEAGVQSNVRSAIDQLEKLGAEIHEVSLPHTKYAVPTYYVILPAEASSNLARFDGVRYGTRVSPAESDEVTMQRLLDLYLSSRANFGAEPKRRIMIGTFVLSSGYADEYYKRAQKVRARIKQDFDDVFQTVDVIVSPTTPTTAFHLGDRTDDPVQMYLADIFTCPINLAGLPAISVPCGESQGMPVGFQIIGKPLDEQTVLRVAYQYEQSRKH